MDPNTLSMEQGKKFLRECGIPQRDIDMMTEKWVVVACVEVLMRFPLLPGEDPTARCVSDKTSQPAVYTPNPTPQNHGDQVKRKCNAQSMKNVEKLPKVMKQMASHCIQPPSQRPTGDNTEKKKCFGAVSPRVPPEEEEEIKSPQVKCKNCGAFGHMARSRMCPMKRWHGALPVQPLGSNMGKEDLKKRKDQDLQTPRMFKTNERGEKERQMQEVLPGKSLSQKFSRSSPEKRMSYWEEPIESCSFVRKPTRPSLFHMNKRKTSLGPVSSGLLPVKIPDMGASTPSCPHGKGPEMSTFGSAQAHDMGLSDTMNPTLKNCQDSGPSFNRISPESFVFPQCASQPPMQTSLINHDVKLQTNMKHPSMDTKSRVQRVRTKSGQEPKVITMASGNKPVQFISPESQGCPKKHQISSCLKPKMRTQGSRAIQVSKFSFTTNGCPVQQAPKMNQEKPVLEASVHKLSLNSSSYPSPVKDTTVFASEKYNTPINFRMDKQQPGFGTSLVPMHKSPAKTKSVAQSQLKLRNTVMLVSNATRSILYDDLLVSSSSEDSDE